MKKLILVICLFIFGAGVPIAAVQALQYQEAIGHINRTVQKNMETYQRRTQTPEWITYGDKKRELVTKCENFEIYEVLDNSFVWDDYEIIDPHTGKLLLRGPKYIRLAETDGINYFWPLNSDSFLWVQNLGYHDIPSVCYLVSRDGTLTPVENDFRLDSYAGQGHFVFEQVDKEHPYEDRWGYMHDSYLYGIVDHDLKTVLAPAEYTGPSLESGGTCSPIYSEGYMLAQKDGKFGAWGWDLKKKTSLSCDALYPRTAQVYDYQNGSAMGVLFLESGATVKNVTYQAGGIRTVVVLTRTLGNNAKYELVDRNGTVLYTLPYSEEVDFSYDENRHPLLNGEPLDIPALTDKSDWAEPVINDARAAGLIPAELDQLYQSNATRRDFCMLAVQLVRVLRPELLKAAESHVEAPYWDCPADLDFMEEINLAAQLGIVSGEGSFGPFLQITSQDAADILKNTAQLLSIKIGQDDLETYLSGSASTDSADCCTIEQSIAAFWNLYQAAVK